MPNHYTTKFKIKVKRTNDPDCKAILAKLIDALKSEESEFDLNRIIPAPAYIWQDNLGGNSLEDKSNLNWYRWNVANWGTNWNTYNVEVSTKDDIEVTYKFHTAWSPPIPVMRLLIEHFGNYLTFHATGRDEGVRQWSVLELDILDEEHTK
jgi:hypothetical protein